MKRRQFIQSAAAGLATAGLGAIGKVSPGLAQGAESLSVRWLGHSCFLFSGTGLRILVNPFRPIGCTAGYRAPQVEADLVLISSRLLDEGVVDGLPGNPRVLFEPGVFEFRGLQLQGIRTPHDDLGGRRFGTNVVWRWRQGGVNVLHLGGAAAPITTEQQILMGRPDVAMVPIGNGPKVFTPEEAQAAIQRLNPKIVIPTQYRTQAADAANCDILPIDNFLNLVQGATVRRVGSDSVTLRSGNLPAEGTEIQVLSYAF
ncbi:MBL fold metallo-hydrolase [Leptolyngbya sp. GB1-A1]|uniref:MBL fold metallo-hydrolase n=2 Tax=Leptolyngbya TaxID=47251 RepID=UPI0019C68C28|nr:MBL fold metallo-hydrolase [Cyanobacteria bacterium FACHB-502]